MDHSAVEIDDGKIGCELCGARVHVIQAHLKESHPDVSFEDYRERWPGARVLSARAEDNLRKRANVVQSAPVQNKPALDSYAGGFNVTSKPLHELFGLGKAKAALGHKGNPIPVKVIEAPEHLVRYVPDIDSNYIFPIDLLKTLMLGLEMNIPSYFWGHMGTGKSTLVEQAFARTGRPFLRVQHTRNTEESHVLGQWLVRDGATVFELGPLAFCMKYGLGYLADEYDFAMPSVLSVYQPVLEGKALIIKDADEHNRVIKPHPLFRFLATGNTNGTGDETGLYQGTMIQNAANYERFGIVEEVTYMDKKIEAGVVAAQGNIPLEDATKMIEFATMIREAFTNGKIGLPISPRSLINAANLGRRRGDLTAGIRLAYVNRLSRVDQEAAREVLKRVAF